MTSSLQNRERKKKKVDYWLSRAQTRNKVGLRDLLEGRKS